MIKIRQDRRLEIINSLKLCINLEKVDLEDYFEKLRQLGKNLISNEIHQKLGKFFNILGSDTRLRILKVLNDKDYCVCELEAILDKSQSSISHHLKLLESVGLIRGVKKGYFTHYELIKDKFLEYMQSFVAEYSFSSK